MATPEDNTINQYLFIHGGPGMNSYAEQKILSPFFSTPNTSFVTWNEPSHLRTTGPTFKKQAAFENAYQSIEKKIGELYQQSEAPVHLIAHSFGAHYAVKACQNIPELIASATLVCPALAIYNVFKNVMNIAHKDFLKIDQTKASFLQQHISQTQSFGDNSFFNGLACALEDRELLNHYWVDEKSLATWVSALTASSEAGFDMESFEAILHSFNITHIQGPKTYIPTQIFFSSRDPIIEADKEILLAKSIFHNLNIDFLDDCGHFAHLEQSKDLVRKLLSSKERFMPPLNQPNTAYPEYITR